MNRFKNIFSTIFVFLAIAITVMVYQSKREMHTRQAEGIILAIQPTNSWMNNCYKITMAVNGTKTTQWEPGEKQIQKPAEMYFTLCEKKTEQIVTAKRAMAEIKKVNITYIDNYYNFEKKLFEVKYTIAIIKINP